MKMMSAVECWLVIQSRACSYPRATPHDVHVRTLVLHVLPACNRRDRGKEDVQEMNSRHKEKQAGERE